MYSTVPKRSSAVDSSYRLSCAEKSQAFFLISVPRTTGARPGGEPRHEHMTTASLAFTHGASAVAGCHPRRADGHDDHGKHENNHETEWPTPRRGRRRPRARCADEPATIGRWLGCCCFFLAVFRVFNLCILMKVAVDLHISKKIGRTCIPCRQSFFTYVPFHPCTVRR